MKRLIGAQEGKERGGDVSHSGERRFQIGLAKQGLQNPVRCCHQRKTRRQRQASDISPDQPQTILQSCAPDALLRAREHGFGSIDADNLRACAGERQRDPAGAAPELENRSVRVQCELTPERHVAPPKRARVLPVVERRILVPTFPSLRKGT